MPYRAHRLNRQRNRELIDYRQAHNLSQAEAAVKLGVSQVTWYYIENGLRVPSVPLAKRMAKMTGVSAAHLLGVGPPVARRKAS